MLLRLALLWSVVGCALVFATPAFAQSVDPAVAEDAIYTYFEADEADFAVAVAECETGLGQDIYNEGSGAHGILQITPETAWDMNYRLGIPVYYSALDDPYHSAWAAKELHDYYESIGEWGFTPWSCAY